MSFLAGPLLLDVWPPQTIMDLYLLMGVVCGITLKTDIVNFDAARSFNIEHYLLQFLDREPGTCHWAKHAPPCDNKLQHLVDAECS